MTECVVCNGALQPAEQIAAGYNGQRYEYCSDECKIVFESSPEHYASGDE